MTRPSDRLAWLALQMVDEAAEQADAGRVAPSLGLRLALAYLHSIADGPIFDRPSRSHIFDIIDRIKFSGGARTARGS